MAGRTIVLQLPLAAAAAVQLNGARQDALGAKPYGPGRHRGQGALRPSQRSSLEQQRQSGYSSRLWRLHGMLKYTFICFIAAGSLCIGAIDRESAPTIQTSTREWRSKVVIAGAQSLTAISSRPLQTVIESRSPSD